MKGFKLFLLIIVLFLPSIIIYAQGATSLRTDRGVSLSYTREFYKKCKEITAGNQLKWRTLGFRTRIQTI